MNTAFGSSRIKKSWRRFVVAILFVGVALPGEARADSTTTGNLYERRAAAEALFVEAKALMLENRHQEACPKFAASQAMDPAVGTRLNLADCLEKIGKTASAWAEFRAAAAAARAKGQTDRAEVAQKRATTLEKQLVRLTIVAPIGSNDSLEIRTNGIVLDRGSWGVALPVDPGHYVIEASLWGNTAFHTEVHVPEKPGSVVTAAIPSLDESAISRARVHQGLAITCGAVGILSFTVGAVLGASAISNNSKSTGHCIAGNICDKTGVAIRNDAMTYGNAATAAFVIGTAAGIGAVVLHMTTPSPKIPPTKIGFGAVQSGVGLIVGGSF